MSGFSVESSDVAQALSKNADLYVTVNEMTTFQKQLILLL